MKTTAWFSAEHKPSRKGWYQARGQFIEAGPGKRGIAWRYWTGRCWMWHSVFVGRMVPAAVGPMQGDEWRGLVAPSRDTKGDGYADQRTSSNSM